jgi:hypothetical protein
MAAILHPLRALRENLRQIGAAVNASRELSCASQPRPDSRVSSHGIPL